MYMGSIHAGSDILVPIYKMANSRTVEDTPIFNLFIFKNKNFWIHGLFRLDQHFDRKINFLKF